MSNLKERSKKYWRNKISDITEYPCLRDNDRWPQLSKEVIEAKHRKLDSRLILAFPKPIWRKKSRSTLVLFFASCLILGLISLTITHTIPSTPDLFNQVIVSTAVVAWFYSLVIIQKRFHSNSIVHPDYAVYQHRMISRRDQNEKKL